MQSSEYELNRRLESQYGSAIGRCGPVIAGSREQADSVALGLNVQIAYYTMKYSNEAQTCTVRGTGATIEHAFQEAIRRGPRGLLGGAAHVIAPPETREVRVHAGNELLASKAATVGLVHDPLEVSVALVTESRRGVFGIGARENEYAVRIILPAVVDVDFGRVTLTFAITSGGTVHRG